MGASGGGGDHMSEKSREEAKAMFVKQLDVLGLVDDMVRDINQPTGTEEKPTERRIDRDGFAKWAGEHDTIKHRIYYSEADAGLYGGLRPSCKDPDDTNQPFIHRALAMEMLHILLVVEDGR